MTLKVEACAVFFLPAKVRRSVKRAPSGQNNTVEMGREDGMMGWGEAVSLAYCPGVKSLFGSPDPSSSL